MRIDCPNCGKHVGDYLGMIEQGHMIESRHFKYANGRSPARGSSSIYACACKHRFDIVGELRKKFRKEIRDAL